jgi:hypothetical protein
MQYQDQEADMTRMQEIEKTILSLPRGEYEKLRRWFLERDWDQWDRKIEEDARAGKLDFLVHEATEAKRQGKLTARPGWR